MPQFDPYVYKALVGFVLFVTAILFLYVKQNLVRTTSQVMKLRGKLKDFVVYFDYLKKNPGLRNSYQASLKFFKSKNKNS